MLVRQLPTLLQPEFFILLGIDIFLAMSLLACLLEKHLPSTLSYLYQIAALVGFGHLLVSKEFMSIFEEPMRFWYSAIYLTIALTNLAAVNFYFAYSKKMLTLAKAFFGAVTLPALAISAFFISNYTSIATYPLLALPPLPPDIIFIGVIFFDTLVIGLGIYLFLQPKWWHIAVAVTTVLAGAIAYTLLKPTWKETAFTAFATILGIACVGVLAASIYVLIRLWREGG